MLSKIQSRGYRDCGIIEIVIHCCLDGYVKAGDSLYAQGVVVWVGAIPRLARGSWCLQKLIHCVGENVVEYTISCTTDKLR